MYGYVLRCRHKESNEVVAIKKFKESEGWLVGRAPPHNKRGGGEREKSKRRGERKDENEQEQEGDTDYLSKGRSATNSRVHGWRRQRPEHA